MPLMIKILLIVCLLAFAVAIHEFTHWFYYYRKYGFKFNLEWWYESPLKCGFRSYFPPVKEQDEKNNLLFAIASGLFVIVVFVAQQHYFIYALPLYFAGCRKDLNRLTELITKEIDL